MKLWDMRKGKNIGSLDIHTRKVNDVLFYEDYKFIATVSDDLHLKVFKNPLINFKKGD